MFCAFLPTRQILKATDFILESKLRKWSNVTKFDLKGLFTSFMPQETDMLVLTDAKQAQMRPF